MADNKVKTKTAILQELESIKGLLFEQDDIPILQEVIDEDGELSVPQEALGQDDLDALHEAFQTLKHTIVKATESSPVTDDALPHNEQPATQPQTQKQILEGEQAPLFDEADDDELDEDELDEKAEAASAGQLEPDNHQYPEFIDTDAQEIHEPALTPEVDSETTSPAQAESPENSPTYSSSESSSESIEEPISFYGSSQDDAITQKSVNNVGKPHTPRPTTNTTKASGENPFLPQHIRARLHGNNPPPLFDTTNMSMPRPRSTSLFGTEATRSGARQDLIRDLVDNLMPQIEQELRQRLQRMTDDELQKLRES